MKVEANEQTETQCRQTLKLKAVNSNQEKVREQH